VGDRRKYLAALLTLDAPLIEKWAKENGVTYASLADLAEDPKVRKLIEGEIAEKNRDLAQYEQVKKFKLLPIDFGIDTGELTPTLKMKRKVVNEKYGKEVEGLYAE
jgi:long-subunit acyl-CoA synthetase (AMP-forming)